MTFSVFLNFNLTLRQQDDIYRYISDYNMFREKGVAYFSDVDAYVTSSVFFFGGLDYSPIIIYIFWTIVYYSGLYLCLRLLLRYVHKDLFSVMLFICAIFFIQPVHYSILRFFTAAFWFIFFVVNYEISGKKLYYALPVLVCSLVHFTFILLVVAYFAYKLYKPSLHTLGVCFLATWVLSFIDLSFVIQRLGFFEGSMYLSDERNTALVVAYNYGRYLYLPMQLVLWYMVYVVYRHQRTLSEENHRLLGVALLCMCCFNLMATSMDATFRFRLVMDWMIVFPVLCYYHTTRSRELAQLVVLLPVCFILSNWDFLFRTSGAMFNIEAICLGDFMTAFEECKVALERIGYTL